MTEYAKLYSESVTIHSPGEFGTTFFTLTGFHGFHVFVGLVALTSLLYLTRDWRAGPRDTGQDDRLLLALRRRRLGVHLLDRVPAHPVLEPGA